MGEFYQRLIIRGATIDEVLSDEFEPLPGQKTNADSAARRLAAWCRSCASGDWSLFEQRLNRDALSLGPVLARFATIPLAAGRVAGEQKAAFEAVNYADHTAEQQASDSNLS